MKTLRLILWRDCNRNCPKCPNKNLPPQPPFDGDFTKYDEIILTGGEPLMRPYDLYRVVDEIRQQTDVPVYMYTALAAAYPIGELLKYIQGITFTVYDRLGMAALGRLNDHLVASNLTDKSLRLIVFGAIPIPQIVKLFWEWEYREYKDDCPIAPNEIMLERRAA